MAYTLRGKVRIELEVQRGRLITQVYVDDVPVRGSEALNAGLATLLEGRRPQLGALSALTSTQILVAEPPQPSDADDAILTLSDEVAIEALPRVMGSTAVTPDASLPISLFVPPERLGPLQSLAAELQAGWQRMLSAAQSRGRTVEAAAAERILVALCRERIAHDPALANLVQADDSEQGLCLTPRVPLMTDDIAYPIETLRFFADRQAAAPARKGSPPLRIRLGAPLARYGLWLGRLGAGLSAEALRASLRDEPPAIAQLIGELRSAGLLRPRPTRPPLDLPAGSVAHLGHACLLANLGGGSVLIDPFLPPASQLDSLRPPSLTELPPLSAIAITHHHWDHVHIESLLKLDKRVPVYLPRQRDAAALRPRSERLLSYLGFTDVRTLAPGESFPVGDGGRVQAVPFFGEDPTRIGYVGCCYALIHGDCAALVHVDSGSDSQGRSLVSTGELRKIAAAFRVLSPVFATRRQELGTLVEHPWEFLLRPAREWPLPTENCNNPATFLAALAQQAQTPCLVIYSEGGADFYPDGTNFLRRPGEAARMAPYEYLWDPWEEIVAAVAQTGSAIHRASPFERFAIGGGLLPGLARRPGSDGATWG
jgi:hypothetical protein